MEPTVVLLHGLGRTHRSMGWLGAGWGPVGGRLGGRLKAAGYPVWTWIDPSRKGSIESLAHRVGSRLARDVPQGPLMAVTHSLGGIILRHLSRQFECEASVLLAPPNGGARVARRAVGKSMLWWYLGPALQDLAQPTILVLPGGWPLQAQRVA